jgi:hypothetical protein
MRIYRMCRLLISNSNYHHLKKRTIIFQKPNCVLKFYRWSLILNRLYCTGCPVLFQFCRLGIILPTQSNFRLKIVKMYFDSSKTFNQIFKLHELNKKKLKKYFTRTFFKLRNSVILRHNARVTGLNGSKANIAKG